MTTLSTSVAIRESVVSAVLGNETVLLDSDTGIYYGLDQVGSRIWELLAHGASREAIVRALLMEFQAEPDTVRADVDEFLQTLEAKRLTRVVNG